MPKNKSVKKGAIPTSGTPDKETSQDQENIANGDQIEKIESPKARRSTRASKKQSSGKSKKKGSTGRSKGGVKKTIKAPKTQDKDDRSVSSTVAKAQTPKQPEDSSVAEEKIAGTVQSDSDSDADAGTKGRGGAAGTKGRGGGAAGTKGRGGAAAARPTMPRTPSHGEGAPWGNAVETPDRGVSTASFPVLDGGSKDVDRGGVESIQATPPSRFMYKKRGLVDADFDSPDIQKESSGRPSKAPRTSLRGATLIARPSIPVPDTHQTRRTDVAVLGAHSPINPQHPLRASIGQGSSTPVSDKTGELFAALLKKQESFDVKMDAMSRSVNTLAGKLEKCEASLQTVLKFMASTLSTKPKESTVRIAAALAPLPGIYSGMFYTRMFGMVFIMTLVSEIKSAQEKSCRVCDQMQEVGDRCTGCYLQYMIAASESVLHAVAYRRLFSEKGRQSSDATRMRNSIHRNLCLHMITTAQNNKSVGKKRFVYGEQMQDVDRPFWLRKNYVTKNHVDEVVLENDDGQVQEEKNNKKQSKKKAKLPVENLLGDSEDRDELARAIVDKLNARNKQVMNKARESVRANFLSKVGFLWESKGNVRYVSKNIEDCTVEESSLPTTMIYHPGKDVDKVYDTNMRKWKDLLSLYRYSMAVLVEYEVSVYQEAVGKGPCEKKTLRTEVNFLTAAISFCARYINCTGGEDLMSVHSSSLKAVFAIASTFRQMVLGHMKNGLKLNGDLDALGEEDDARNIDTLIYDLVPPSVSAREKILVGVFEMSAKTYAEKHIPSGNTGSNAPSASAEHRDEDDEVDEESDGEVDQEMLAMQDMVFNEGN